MAAKVAINGFGRIGRITLRTILEYHRSELQVVAVNDLVPINANAHLFKYDTNYGPYKGAVSVEGNSLIVDGLKIACLQEKELAKLPWRALGVDVVLECTGRYTDGTKAKGHIDAGCKKVIISAPAKPDTSVDATIVLGVNEATYDPKKHHVISNASCTTNCLAPLAKALHSEFKIIEGFMTTCHAYTNDQRVLDLAHDDMRRARAAAQNIIPSSTGAAKAIGLVIPELKGRLDGIALRVPVPTVSIVDLVCTVETKLVADPKDKEARKAAAKRVNEALKKHADGKYLAVCEEELVSSDLRGSSISSIVDASQTNVIGTNMVKVLSWYDNEWGYSCRLADLAAFLVGKGL